MLVCGALIFALVMILLLLAFRRRKDTGSEARGVRVWIVSLGLAFPIAVLAALLAYGLVEQERLLPHGGDDVTRVAAQARRWVWTFTYDDVPGQETQGVLHIPAGRPVDVAITTVDLIHSFWVPRLAGKLDAIPGHINVLRIEADMPGTYEGVSAEFSGVGYDDFTFEIIAHDAAQWEDFVKGVTE